MSDSYDRSEQILFGRREAAGLQKEGVDFFTPYRRPKELLLQGMAPVGTALICSVMLMQSVLSALYSVSMAIVSLLIADLPAAKKGFSEASDSACCALVTIILIMESAVDILKLLTRTLATSWRGLTMCCTNGEEYQPLPHFRR